MKPPPFELERFLAAHEFSARHLLCASDCEAMSIQDLLSLEPQAPQEFQKTWLGYTETLGHPALREGISGLYRGINPSQILVHSGAGEPIYAFMNVALRPGDRVIVQWPCYQSLFQIAASLGCEVIRWEGREETGWAPDFSELEAALQKPTRAIILNQPHNPTGYLMSQPEFKAVAQLAESRGVLLFCDEVYRGLEQNSQEQLPAACEISETAVSLGVMSKAFGLAGLRIGWIATRNQQVFQDLLEFKDYNSICASAPSEYLASLALRHSGQILARNREIIRTNLAQLDQVLARHPDRLSWVRPHAGCIGFARVKDSQGAERFASDALQRHRVLLAPSSKFGYGNHHVRVGFGRRSSVQSIAAFANYLSE